MFESHPTLDFYKSNAALEWSTMSKCRAILALPVRNNLWSSYFVGLKGTHYNSKSLDAFISIAILRFSIAFVGILSARNF